MMESLLRIEDLSVEFVSGKQSTTALKSISFTVNAGEIVALVGESGSGKSVTSLSILQLLPSPPARYSSGKIFFCPHGEAPIDLLRQSAKELQEIRGNQIGMIFQEPMTSLNPVLTCGRQVMEALLTHRKLSAAEARKQTIEWFEKVKLPDPISIFSRYPHQLSGGQKQRVMIAMAICCRPALLICDEPTTALDVTVQKTILELIKELQREYGMGVIFITHDLGVVAEIADRTIVMYKGAIVEQDKMREIFIHPHHPYTKGLLACRPILHRKGERLPVVGDFLSDAPLTHTVPGTIERPVTNEKMEVEKDTGPLMRVENLSVWFPSRRTFLGKTLEVTKAVDNISLHINKGETVGLVGESGCGKTTLGRSLLRLIQPTAGKIYYEGKDLLTSGGEQQKRLRKEIQIVFQDPYSSLNPRLTIGSAIAEALKVHHILPTERQRKERVAALLEKVDLKAEHLGRYPHEFSGGQRQRIVIARALALDPSFVVCDESVSALDVSVQAQVLNLLNDLKKEFGFTVLFISHDLSVVRYISDRILVMNKGRIEESGAADDIYFRPQSDYTKKLIASIPKGIVA
jgi:peptide/nickel transport system ATP-binding protein